MQSQNTAKVVRELDNLPPLPRQAQQLLAILGDPDLDTAVLIELLRQSPALAARILGIARSSFFAGNTPPRDLADAVIRFLGLALVRDLAIAFTLSVPLPTDRCTAFAPSRYWRHALLTAALAERLAARHNTPLGSQAYLAGLLHNLGLLALVHLAPAGMQTVFIQAESLSGQALLELERELLGVDHCQAGEMLAVVWDLPRELARVMALHRNHQYGGEDWELVILIALAERFCAAATPLGEGISDELISLQHRLGLDAQAWGSALGGWQEQVAGITELSRQFK